MKLVVDIILIELLLDNMPYEELVGYYEYTDADIAEESRAFMADTTPIPLRTSQANEKPANATKRAVVGTIIGGVPGAIIGVDSNSAQDVN